MGHSKEQCQFPGTCVKRAVRCLGVCRCVGHSKEQCQFPGTCVKRAALCRCVGHSKEQCQFPGTCVKRAALCLGVVVWGIVNSSVNSTVLV